MRGDERAQLLLLTGIIFTITMLIVAAATVRYAVVEHQTDVEDERILAAEYENVKASFAGALDAAVNTAYTGGPITDRKDAVAEGVERVASTLATVEARHGLNFRAEIGGEIIQLDTTHFEVPICFSLTSSSVTVRETVSYQIEFALDADIAIFAPTKEPASSGWLNDDTIDREATYLELNLAARSLVRYDYPDGVAVRDWCEEHTGDRERDILVIFDWAPELAYGDGTLEAYLDDGNFIIYTGDWSFYYTIAADGSRTTRGSNGFRGLLDISDGGVITYGGSSTYDATSAAEILPSLPGSYIASRPIVGSHLSDNWVIEQVYSEQRSNSDNKDAVLIRNTVTSAYFAQFFMNADQTNPRGAVIEEFIENYIFTKTG